jgi:hypothetical protein
MGIVSPFDRARSNPRERTGARPPSLRLTLRTGDPVADAALGIVTIHIRATGARLPVRLYLYVNGDLAESWTEREATFDFSLDVYGPGRHSVRARAVDAIGRWAGASTILAAVAGAEAS